jgi:1-aminocyclopropane-1-carboxylate deaminase/D-cysteine desulfhydrase-like pyridoxal-dependent ACC family enzyme
MKLKFITRNEYRNKEDVKRLTQNVYWIEEGGYGSLGAAGASEILSCVKDGREYSHIICAIGTGTTLAGLIAAAKAEQQVIGVSAMKGNKELTRKICQLLQPQLQKKRFAIFHDFHFGGYAKFDTNLLNFMNMVWRKHSLPTDIVYTAKTLYATQQLILDDTVKTGSKVLMIHTGGLQGNLSLSQGLLQF